MPTTKITREELLARTWALIHERGYHATSIASVAQAAGIAKAGVLHHFGTKEAMMRAVVAWARGQYASYVLGVFAKAGARADGGTWTLEARLAEVLKRQFHLATLNDHSGCFFGNAILETGGSGPFGELLQGFFSDWTAAAATALLERFDAPEAERRAYDLFAAYQGAILLYRLNRDPAPLERFRQAAVAGLSDSAPSLQPVPQ